MIDCNCCLLARTAVKLPSSAPARLPGEHHSPSPYQRGNMRVCGSARRAPQVVGLSQCPTIRNLKHVFAVFTSSDSPKFKCLVSDAVRFDPIHMVATYVWTFKGLDGTEKKTSSFDISPGSAPDQLTFYTNNVCMLWADRTVAASIPKDCEEQYEGTCEVSFPDYDQDICDVAEK
ncbi:uncharacterized protein LOC144134786 isoform X3 [Amblyomma americanum]